MIATPVGAAIYQPSRKQQAATGSHWRNSMLITRSLLSVHHITRGFLIQRARFASHRRCQEFFRENIPVILHLSCDHLVYRYGKYLLDTRNIFPFRTVETIYIIIFGMNPIFDKIEKPTLLLNEAVTRMNIQRMVHKAQSAGVRFRPHFKTHQSSEIGNWFRKEGVTAITVSSIDMALYFARSGWQNITIAFPANLRQWNDLVWLSRQVHLGLLIESVETVSRMIQPGGLSADIWLKVDVGSHRTGLPWDQPDLFLPIIAAIQSAPDLRLVGLLTHASQTYAGRGASDVERRYLEATARMNSLRQQLATRGVGSLLLSVGDTPGCSLANDLGPVDEIRPGNFVFYDSTQLQIGACRASDIAVAVACPVVARHRDRYEIVIHGGSVHLSSDFFLLGERRAYGLVALPGDYSWSDPLDGAFVARLSQEHGIIQVNPGDFNRIQVGDLVCVLPAHSCLTVTLMKRFLTLDNQQIDTMNV